MGQMIWQVTSSILLLEMWRVLPQLAYEAKARYLLPQSLGEEMKRGRSDGEHVQPWQIRVFPGDRRGLADGGPFQGLGLCGHGISSSSRDSDKELKIIVLH